MAKHITQVSGSRTYSLGIAGHNSRKNELTTALIRNGYNINNDSEVVVGGKKSEKQFYIPSYNPFTGDWTNFDSRVPVAEFYKIQRERDTIDGFWINPNFSEKGNNHLNSRLEEYLKLLQPIE